MTSINRATDVRLLLGGDGDAAKRSALIDRPRAFASALSQPRRGTLANGGPQWTALVVERERTREPPTHHLGIAVGRAESPLLVDAHAFAGRWPSPLCRIGPCRHAGARLGGGPPKYEVALDRLRRVAFERGANYVTLDTVRTPSLNSLFVGGRLFKCPTEIATPSKWRLRLSRGAARRARSSLGGGHCARTRTRCASRRAGRRGR